MAVSIHEMLELNSRKPFLNKYIKYFENEGKKYAYMNRFPYRISIMELTDRLINIFSQFDGNKTVNDIYVANSLSYDFFDFVKVLYRNSFFRETTDDKEFGEPEILTILFFPTTTCNLRCIYCYASAGEIPASVIDIDKARTWINFIFENIPPQIKSVRVLFHGGGEPTNAITQMKEIWEMVKEKCRERGFKAKIHSISNGNFNKEVLDWFIKERAHVFFSMDGLQAEHDKQRPRADGKGSFEIAIQNMKKLKEGGIGIGFRCTVTNINKDSLKDFIDFGKEWELKFMDFEPCNSYGRGTDLNSTNISNEDFIEKYLDAWEYGYNKGVLIKGLPVISLHAGRNYFCNNYSVISFALTSDGALSPCPEVSQKTDPAADAFITGRINDDQSIDFFNDRVDNLKNRKSENIEACRNCFLEYVCNGGCAIKSYRRTGDLLKVDEEECAFLKTLSPKILKAVLYEYTKFPKNLKFDNFIYSDGMNKDLYANYLSFNPFDFVNY